MSGYLQFRSWARTGSPAEKKLASAALVIVVGLTAWALVPTGGPAGNSVSTGLAGGTAAAGAGPGVAGAQASSTGAAVGSGPSGAVTGTGGPSGGGAVLGGTSVGGGGAFGPAGSSDAPILGPTGTPAASCGKLTNSDTGVTPTEIKVADILLNLAGAIGNSAVGQASPQIQRQMAQAVVDDINAHGGVACRKLVVSFYEANPIDPTSTQNVCLQIAQAGVFAVIGGFAYPASANDCLAQQKIPLIANVAPTPSEAKQYYPYLMSAAPDPTTDFANAIFGMKTRGFFTAAQGFQKIAILEDDCSPEVNKALYNDLIQSGVPSRQIVKNDFSCPSSGFASPNDMSQFATQDNLAHITNVVVATGGGSFKEFSNAAKGQGYKPKYLVSNYDGFLVTATGDTGPDPGNFDGTIVTTDTRFGENNTPGLTDPATQACIALFARHGLPSSYITGSYIGGNNCTLFLLFAAAAGHDQGLTRAGLAGGLGQVGRFAMVFPSQDSIYKAPGTTTPVKVTGGDYWWTIQFSAACTCWKVIDPTLHPSVQ